MVYEWKQAASKSLFQQAAEQISKLEWVGKNDLKKYLQNSFPLINDVT
jgi:hypothetical protein